MQNYNTIKKSEIGIRTVDGEYLKIFETEKETEVNNYIDILKRVKCEGTNIVKMEQVYECISTVPFVVE